MMKKSGFTLVETMASIYILTIVLFEGITLSKFGRSMESEIKNNECLYEIQNVFSYGKAVCREKNKYGKITIKSNDNEVRFVEGWDSIEKIVTLPKDITIISKDINLWITPDGKISNGYTLKIIDKDGYKKEVTIGVGVDRIVIHNGDEI